MANADQCGPAEPLMNPTKHDTPYNPYANTATQYALAAIPHKPAYLAPIQLIKIIKLPLYYNKESIEMCVFNNVQIQLKIHWHINHVE